MSLRRLLAAALIAGVLGFYGWTATSNWPAGTPLFGPEQDDYDNLLLHAFQHGHLYLPIAPDPRLLAAANPYDPAQRPAGTVAVHDLSYFRGHYYLYFGVTPVVVLLLPWRLLTGHDLPQTYAVLIFTSLGFLVASALWLAIRRRYFPRSSGVVLLSGFAVLGLASMGHAVLRRPGFWEEPIAAAYAGGMFTLYCLFRSLQARRSVGWLMAAGFALGLTVGARPNYAVGAIALAAPLWLAWREERKTDPKATWPGRSWWTLAVAAGLALAIPVAGLLWYNAARFGNPLEFGWHYEMNGDGLAGARVFGAGEVWSNFYYYYLSPAQWSRYFPFAETVHPLAGSSRDIEYVYGLLANLPFAWLALAAPLAGRAIPVRDRARWRAFVGALVLFYAAIGGLMLFFSAAATARYMLDFTPALMLLAVIGLLGIEAATDGGTRRAVCAAGAGLAAFSAGIGVLLSFQAHALLRQMNPAAYDRIAHTCDLPVAWVERWMGHRFGPLDLVLQFPRGAPGSLEPLLTTGWEYESDNLFLRYLDAGQVQFGFAHAGFPVSWSPVMAVDQQAAHRVVIQMGSLFPPRGHPFFDRMDRFAAAGLSRWLRVTVDGRLAFDQAQDFYDGSAGSARLGTEVRSLETYGRRFSGTILSAKTDPLPAPAPFVAGYGAREMTLAFPGDTDRALPLVTTGIPGKGDALRVRMVRPGVIRFGYDDWGVGFWESGEVVAASGVRHVLRVETPALLGGGGPMGELKVSLDGREVWRQRVPFYPATPAVTYFGENPIGASTCEPTFTGVICAVRRL